MDTRECIAVLLSAASVVYSTNTGGMIFHQWWIQGVIWAQDNPPNRKWV